LEDIEYETWVSKSNKKKQTKKDKRRITMATRTSSRVPKDGRTMMEKAKQHAKERNELSKGKNNSNQFLVLNNLSNEDIKNVTDNLDITIENIDDQIEVFRVEERARATFAEANRKEYLASVNKKTAPQGDEEL
jgi:small-conductance mechanosensitive channel